MLDSKSGVTSSQCYWMDSLISWRRVSGIAALARPPEQTYIIGNHELTCTFSAGVVVLNSEACDADDRFATLR